jgi:hypothetical protein
MVGASLATKTRDGPMQLLIVGATVVAFLVGFRLSGIVPAATRAMATAQAATAVMRNPALTDEHKEVAVRKAGLSLLASSLSILLRGLVAVLVAVVPIVLADLLGLADAEASLTFLTRWEVILATSAGLTAVWLIVVAVWRPS